MFSDRIDSAFRDFLRLKYQEVRFDLVVAMQDVGARLRQQQPRHPVSRHARRVPDEQSGHRSGRPNSTGLIHERNFAATVTLIRQLQPDVRHIFVVTGAAQCGSGVRERVPVDRCSRSIPD